jgi:flagellar basal body-associated protein FliL
MKKLFPILFLLLGSGAGVAAGIYLRPSEPEPEPSAVTEPDAEAEVADTQPLHDAHQASSDGKEYVKLSNQFVVPLVKDNRVSAMVVMTLSVEVSDGQAQIVYDKEPKLRDTILKVLFDHASIGGFDGDFTNVTTLENLRIKLRNASMQALGGDVVSDVLIFEIARQDY